MTLPSPLLPGAVVAERYRVERVLGEGGMGQVVEVEHLALGRRFALKVLRAERWSDELVARFQREARALARVTTPRVAQVTDFGIDPQHGPFYVMELLDGETLEARIVRDGRLTTDDAVGIAAEIAAALAEVHAAAIVHRDLKPSNVGLPAGGPVRVKLLDFGLAAALDQGYLERITKSQQVLGSLPYMAPEQFHGAEPSAGIDLYALGVVTFEMLTGRLPFDAPSTAALMHRILSAPTPLASSAAPGIPPVVDAVISRLLARDPVDRFASAAAAATALHEARGAARSSSLPPTRFDPQPASPAATATATAPMPPWSSSVASALPAGAPTTAPLGGPTPPYGASSDGGPIYRASVPGPTASTAGAASGSLPPTIPSAAVAATAPRAQWSSQQVVPPTTAPAAASASTWIKIVAAIGLLGLLLGGLAAAGIVVVLGSGETRETPHAASAPDTVAPLAVPTPPLGPTTEPIELAPPRPVLPPTTPPELHSPSASPDAGPHATPARRIARPVRTGHAADPLAGPTSPTPPTGPSPRGVWQGDIIEDPE